VLDRIDSLLAVLPWLALILWQIGLAEPAKLL
jgi:CDP-diglyceride synthetase